jgi:secondary thiamine-phosphate synthase enzyme
VKQAQLEIQVPTRGKGLYDITRQVASWVGNQKMATGLVTVFISHTSASLTIQENADPDVQRDICEFFERLVPEDTPWFRHTVEGPDDMPSHIRSVLTSPQLSIPVRAGRLALGTWQAIYVFEHRSGRQSRNVIVHLTGE